MPQPEFRFRIDVGSDVGLKVNRLPMGASLGKHGVANDDGDIEMKEAKVYPGASAVSQMDIQEWKGVFKEWWEKPADAVQEPIVGESVPLLLCLLICNSFVAFVSCFFFKN